MNSLLPRRRRLTDQPISTLLVCVGAKQELYTAVVSCWYTSAAAGWGGGRARVSAARGELSRRRWTFDAVIFARAAVRFPSGLRSPSLFATRDGCRRRRAWRAVP